MSWSCSVRHPDPLTVTEAAGDPERRDAREWNYRFNGRRRIVDLMDLLLGRAETRAITYRQFVDGTQLNGTPSALTGYGEMQ